LKRTDIISGLRDLLRQQKELKIPIDSISEDTLLVHIGFDSLTILDFLYDLESRFQVRMEVTDLIRFERVRDLIDHLAGQLPG
jgi:acyl carrier protein